MDKAYYIDNMTKIWRIKGLAVESLKTYIGCLNVYLDHFNCPPLTITREQRWDYFSSIQSPSTRSQAMTVVRQMYEHLLNSPIHWQELPYVKKPDTIPQYFTLEETKRLINAISNPKQRCIVAMQYACGLRVHEVVKIRQADINSKLKELRIKGKGGKERMVPLPDWIIQEIKTYWHSAYRPKNDYLFEGQYGGHYDERSVQQVVAAAKKKAGITKPCSTHGLRHAAATHRLNNQQWDLRSLQVFLGHRNSKTTERYTHVSIDHLNGLKAPEITNF